MSHGATIAITNLKGETRSTRVTWAAKLDRSIGQYLAGAERDRENLDRALLRLLREITKHKEIETLTGADQSRGKSHESLSHGLRIENPRGTNRRARQGTAPVLIESLEPEALAAHYDMRSPGYLTFHWIDPLERASRSRRSSLKFLAHYYRESELLPRKLKRFGNLRS